MDGYRPSSTIRSPSLEKYPTLQRSFDNLESFLLNEVVSPNNKERVLEMLINVKECAEKEQEDSISVSVRQYIQAQEVAPAKNSQEEALHNDETNGSGSQRNQVDILDNNEGNDLHTILLKKDYRKLTKEKKNRKNNIIFMIEAVKEVIEQRKMKRRFKDEKIKSWIHKIAKPCLCVEICYSGNVDAFVKAHPSFIYSKHVCTNKKKHETPLKELERLHLDGKY
jgi:hypothetical protein